MENLFNKITGISCHDSILITRGMQRQINYIINQGEKEKTSITVNLPYSTRPKVSHKIINSSNKFINGFKVVQTANLEYAFVRESDGLLLPYRYDIVSDFNKHGYAMVGKDGNVTWINRDFQYLDRNGKMITESIEDKHSKYDKFGGFQEVNEFSTGNHPLSRVYEGKNNRGKSFYFSPDGTIKRFYPFDGTLETRYAFSSFAANTFKDFEDKDYIINKNGILLAKGYYCSIDYILNCYEQNISIAEICEKANQETKKAYTKAKQPNQ